MSNESSINSQLDKLLLITFKFIKYLFYTLLTIVIGLIALSIMTGGMCYVPPERLKLSEIMVMSSALKTEISEIMLQTNVGTVDVSTLNTGMFNCQGQPNCYVKSIEVKSTGAFKIDAAPIKSVIAFVPTPKWDENKEMTGIHWECVGHPAKYMPANCRIDKSLSLKEKSCQFCH
jgi:hypothetical protein